MEIFLDLLRISSNLSKNLSKRVATSMMHWYIMLLVYIIKEHNVYIYIFPLGGSPYKKTGVASHFSELETVHIKNKQVIYLK
jgi:hypothetical protein